MLDLQPRIDFEEPEIPRRFQHELDGPRAPVPDGLRDGQRDGTHAVAQAGVDGGRGALFDDFLVTALDGALALEAVHGSAVVISENLDLDMPGSRDVWHVEIQILADDHGGAVHCFENLD